MVATASYRTWAKDELALIKLVKNNPILYARGIIPSKHQPIMNIWQSIAEEIKKPLYECRATWDHFRKYYITLRKQQLQGVKNDSKFLDGSLSFLDDEIDELRNILSDNSSKRPKGKTMTVLTITTIDKMLKERKDDPDIDSATLQYLFKILTDRIETAFMSKTPVTTSNKKPGKKVYAAKAPQIVETTPITKPHQIETTTKANTVNLVLLNISENVQNRKLIIKHPEKINMDSVIKDIASQDLPIMNNSELFESTTVNKNSGNESQQMDNATIDLDEDEIDSMNIDDNDQSQAIESNTTKSTEKEEIDTVFDLHCRRKDTRIFFKDLGEYVLEKFSPAKQKEIRLKICSIITEAELEDME